MGIKNRFRRSILPRTSDRLLRRLHRPWITLSLLALTALGAACGFPRPPDLPADDATPAPTGCSRDPDCSSPTPFCVNTACVACRDTTSCPITRPVCDAVSHDCRTCIQDSECDSGACDLAAGRCVDQAAILFASPGGSNADPCTTTSPCSMRHAAELIDASRPYIVLRPGRYSGGADFSAKKAAIAGHGAVLDIVDDGLSIIYIRSGSSINIRDLDINDHLTSPPMDALPAITVFSSELTIENMHSNTTYAESSPVAYSEFRNSSREHHRTQYIHRRIGYRLSAGPEFQSPI